MNKQMDRHEQRIKAAIIDGRNRGVCDKDGNTIPRVKLDGGHKAAAFHAFRNSDYWQGPEDQTTHGELVK